MAEAARAFVLRERLRIRLRIADSARAQELGNVLHDLGHVVADAGDADFVLTCADSDVLAVTTDHSGAHGVLALDASRAQINAALRAIAAGLNVYAVEDHRFSALEEHEAPSPLTPRELEILIALSDGLSNKAIARRFDISQHTVKFHVESIFRKLGTTSRAEAVVKGLRRGLVHL